MYDIRKWWPDITNFDICILTEYNCYELLLIERLIHGHIWGGKEISQEDLLQGVPTDKLGDLKDAAKVLYKKGILRIKPKLNLVIYQVESGIYSEPLTEIAKHIRSDESLKKALIENQVHYTKTSDAIETTLRKAIGEVRGSHQSYEIKASESESVFKGQLGIIVELEFKCRSCHNSKQISFEILDPRDIHMKIEVWECCCGSTNNCCASGRMY